MIGGTEFHVLIGQKLVRHKFLNVWVRGTLCVDLYESVLHFLDKNIVILGHISPEYFFKFVLNLAPLEDVEFFNCDEVGGHVYLFHERKVKKLLDQGGI